MQINPPFASATMPIDPLPNHGSVGWHMPSRTHAHHIFLAQLQSSSHLRPWKPRYSAKMNLCYKSRSESLRPWDSQAQDQAESAKQACEILCTVVVVFDEKRKCSFGRGRTEEVVHAVVVVNVGDQVKNIINDRL